MIFLVFVRLEFLFDLLFLGCYRNLSPQKNLPVKNNPSSFFRCRGAECRPFFFQNGTASFLHCFFFSPAHPPPAQNSALVQCEGYLQQLCPRLLTTATRTYYFVLCGAQLQCYAHVAPDGGRFRTERSSHPSECWPPW